jgi:hypothetical protein
MGEGRGGSDIERKIEDRHSECDGQCKCHIQIRTYTINMGKTRKNENKKEKMKWRK